MPVHKGRQTLDLNIKALAVGCVIAISAEQSAAQSAKSVFDAFESACLDQPMNASLNNFIKHAEELGFGFILTNDLGDLGQFLDANAREIPLIKVHSSKKLLQMLAIGVTPTGNDFLCSSIGPNTPILELFPFIQKRLGSPGFYEEVGGRTLASWEYDLDHGTLRLFAVSTSVGGWIGSRVNMIYTKGAPLKCNRNWEH